MGIDGTGIGIALIPYNTNLIREESDFPLYMPELDERGSVHRYYTLLRERLSQQFPGLIVGWTVHYPGQHAVVVGVDGAAVRDAIADIEFQLWNEPDLFILERE